MVVKSMVAVDGVQNGNAHVSVERKIENTYTVMFKDKYYLNSRELHSRYSQALVLAQNDRPQIMNTVTPPHSRFLVQNTQISSPSVHKTLLL